MEAGGLRLVRSRLLAGLEVHSPADKAAHTRLSTLLERSATSDDLDRLVARRLPTEFSPGDEPDTGDPDRTAEFRVFRREAPVAAAGAAFTLPEWGRGAAVAETIGPLQASDGRLFWYDFFRIVRLIPIHFDGDAQPAFLFNLRERRFGLRDTIDLREVLGLLQRPRYVLEGGSIWLRADLLAAGAPAGTYVGLKVRGGSLAFTPPVVVQSGRLTIPLGGRCAIHLDLDPPAAPPAGGGDAGRDAADATLALPDFCDLDLANGRAIVSRAGAARWTLYGQTIGFAARQEPVPTWEPALSSVFVPYEVSEPAVELVTVASRFAPPAGRARIDRGGWALPVAAIDVTRPSDASGIGGLAVRARTALSITWRGLRNDPLTLPSAWIALSPGLVLVTDGAAASPGAEQRLRLWQESSPPGRSTIDLRYATPSQLTYLSAATGAEVLMAHGDADARLDRPVDVAGTPLPVRTRGSLLVLSFTDAVRLAFLYDGDILADAAIPGGVMTPRPVPRALAIRNALFTTTPVNSLLLFAALRDDEVVERATLMLGAGLYAILPTLPDPYAANVGLTTRRRGPEANTAPITHLLVAGVTWQKAATDDRPDTIQVGFTVALASEQVRALPPGAASDLPVVPTTTPEPFVRGHKPVGPAWDALFSTFGREQFVLLDVSSNADQMGVSFAYFDPRRHPGDRSEAPFDLVYGGGAAAPGQPLEVRDLDLSAQARFVRAFTVPQVSWDPILNLTPPRRFGDPPQSMLLFPNDGGPTRLLNDDVTVVPIAPIPVSNQLVDDFAARQTGFTGALFTLPYGLLSFAEFNRVPLPPDNLGTAKLALNRPDFESGAIVGGIQIRADAPPQNGQSPTFRGCTVQLPNLHLPNGNPTGANTLGASVSTIFNEEFFFDGPTRVRNLGVPVERLDFSGYGASIFSHWESTNATIAATSQAKFDVFVGRTAHEVIQVRSLVYPWGIRVVRTITLFRASSAYTYRWDSGWQPESDGVFDFSYRVKMPDGSKQTRNNPFEFHPGVVHGVFSIRNILETDTIPPFTAVLNKAIGDPYIDQDNIEQTVDGSTPPEEQFPGVELQPVYFDGDFEIDGVVAGATGGRVPSKGILGYVQLKPRGEPILPDVLRTLLNSQFGSIGAAIDAEIDVAGSGQRLRVSRVDVNPSIDLGGQDIFVVAARGAMVLPRGGAWSIVRHEHGSGEVAPFDPNLTVPLIRRGKLLNPATHLTDAAAADLFRIANPIDLVQAPGSNTRHYGILQTTGTQKALIRQPRFQQGLKQLLGEAPDFADAYRLVNTKGIFPNVKDAVSLSLGAFTTSIIPEGYKLVDPGNPAGIFKQPLIPGPLKLIDESFLKIYVEYVFAKNDKLGTPARPGVLEFGFDSAAAAGQQWLSKVDDIAMVVDLGSIQRLVAIKGRFAAEHGAAPAFRTPELVFSDELQPVIDILQILVELQGGDYAEAMQKGLDVAMSNSAASWSYAFHARKEFPVVQFPPGPLYHAPQTPFKLRAHLALGAYFNESVSPSPDPKQLVPTAGAYLEFGGSLSVMCVSLAVATVYAVGTVDLRISGDTKAGPGLAMKFGFGAELVVGLPVVGNVSLLYMVGVEVSLDLTQVTVSAFLLFRGRAELLGGIITITIQIEARGSYQRVFGPPDETNMIAQVTFAIDVSIFLVINLHFSESWQEQRQIA